MPLMSNGTPSRVPGYPAVYLTANGVGPAAGANVVKFKLGRPGKPFEIVGARIEPVADIALDADATTFAIGSGADGSTAVGSVTNETAAITADDGVAVSLTASAVNRAADDQVLCTITNVVNGQDLSSTDITVIVEIQWR